MARLRAGLPAERTRARPLAWSPRIVDVYILVNLCQYRFRSSGVGACNKPLSCQKLRNWVPPDGMTSRSACLGSGRTASRPSYFAGHPFPGFNSSHAKTSRAERTGNRSCSPLGISWKLDTFGQCESPFLVVKLNDDGVRRRISHGLPDETSA